MNSHVPKRLAAVAAAVALTAGGAVVVAPAAAAAPASGIDYFADAFPGLRADSVFTAVTFERFERLLQSEGTYAFLIGGPADPTTAAAVEHIDAVAQGYGVDTIYTFDPRLDGASLDIRTTANEELGALYDRLVTEYLNKDSEPAFGDAATDPYLFVYDKSHKVGEVEDRIVASLGGTEDTASPDTAAEIAVYRAQISEVFDAIAIEGAAEVDTQSQFEFFRSAMNERHTTSYPDASLYGGDIFTEADGANFVLQSVTYPELTDILESDGEHVILFGGTWCHNTRAVIKEINEAAAAAGTDTVYVFDLRLDGLSGGDAHIRDTNSEFAHLYGDLAAEYLTNLRTQYDVLTGSRVDYHPGGDLAAPLAAAQKLQVPYLIRYDNSKTAPIVTDWIHDNGDGTFKEYMTERWWVTDLPGKIRPNQTPEEFAAVQAAAWAFADEALAKIDGFFGLATAPDAPEAPTLAADGQDLTVTWTAPDDGDSALTGFQVSLDGAAPVVVAGDATSHVFSDVTAGSHSVTVVAVNYIGPSAASPAATVVVEAPEEPEPTPAVSVTGDLRPGGSIVVTGSGLPADTAGVRVELHSTPQVLGTVTTTAEGTFRLTATIPAAVAPGAHAVVVFVDGVEVARTAVTVVAATPASGTLPATGGTGIPLLVTVAAILFVGIGGALVAWRRRAGSAV